MTETAVAEDGVAVAIHRLGAREGTLDTAAPLVLAHATGLHGWVWQPVAGELADGFDCVAPDLRGHGDTPAPADGDFDWRGFAADLLAAIDALGLVRPVALGHSSGATAVLLAEQARPGTFAGVYAYEPVLVPADPPLGRDPDSWLAQAARRRRAAFADIGEARAHYAQRRSWAGVDPAVVDCFVAHGLRPERQGGHRLKCEPEHEARVYEMATAHDAFGRLAAVACPVAVVYGSDSEAFSPAHADELAAALPAGRVERHPGLGHLGPLQAPARVAGAARDALSGLR